MNGSIHTTTLRAATPARNRARAEELWQARRRFVGYLREIMGTKRLIPSDAGLMGRSVRLAPLEAEPPGPASPRRRKSV